MLIGSLYCLLISINSGKGIQGGGKSSISYRDFHSVWVILAQNNFDLILRSKSLRKKYVQIQVLSHLHTVELRTLKRVWLFSKCITKRRGKSPCLGYTYGSFHKIKRI